MLALRFLLVISPIIILKEVKYMFPNKILTLVAIAFILFSACSNPEKEPASKNDSHTNEIPVRHLNQDFKDYWYSGKAEITTYQLSQVRYGELREGTAVNIFVTEDFLPNEQVKANNFSENNIPVLKLNNTKKFITGIYPYSIMNSTFSPLTTKQHPLKISTSSQEWCGQVYMQLNNADEFNIISHSYFEGEADQNISLEKELLENEIWNLIRIDPNELPTGDFMMIPSFEYIRLNHKEAKPYKAIATLTSTDSLQVHTIHYPDLPRQLTIFFNSSFPYEIERWEESSFTSPSDTLGLKTIATKINRIRTNYWAQNSNDDKLLRSSMGL